MIISEIVLWVGICIALFGFIGAWFSTSDDNLEVFFSIGVIGLLIEVSSLFLQRISHI